MPNNHRLLNWKLPLNSDRGLDRLWAIGLLLAALVLYCTNLGGLPLRDWDEGLVAQVAREIWRSPAGSLTWLHPTLAGDPYLNKPPLIHWLIALAFKLGGVNEVTARLPGALLTATSVPLLYSIGRELFPLRTSAIFSALVYLTLLPVVRHGRLAMLDGALICFFLVLVFCLLRTRRNLRWGLGVGIAFGLLCMTKGIVALLLGTIALIFVWLDTPRLLTSCYLWAGVGLGSLPVIAWYGAQWLYYGTAFTQLSLIDQSFSRIWNSVENNTGSPAYYLWEILKYGLPWLIVLPQGFQLAWQNRNLAWAKLALVWAGGYLLVISIMTTKLPWYVLPIYPALALVAGAKLAEVWNPDDGQGVRTLPQTPFPLVWTIMVGLVAIAGWGSSVYFSPFGPSPRPDLSLILLSLALTMTVAAILLIGRDSQFIPVLLWGMYVALLLLLLSQYWVWELDEQYSVSPVAELVRQHTSSGTVIRTSYPLNRPSLNFYSDRQVIPTSVDDIKTLWQEQPVPYLLLERSTFDTLSLSAAQILGQAEGFVLVTK